MDGLTLALAVAVAALAIGLLLLVARGRNGSVERQLAELRGRLDELVRAQGDVPRALAEGSAEQVRSLADVREQLARLEGATARLETVGQAVLEVQELLKVPKLRGALGEVWLEELLGQVFPGALYEMQFGFRSGERVDAVLHVGDRLLPIDAKFPLEACQRILAAPAGEAEGERRAFRRTLKARIDEIADKYIRPDEGTFDFALMYVPAERVYYEAVVRDDSADQGGGVVAYALDRRVIPVSPNTFYAYVQAILHGLRGLEVEQRAREILASLAGLRQHLTAFERSYGLVGRHFDHARKAYEEAATQLVAVRERLERLTN